MIITINRLKALCHLNYVKINKQFGKMKTLKVVIDLCKKINIQANSKSKIFL